MVRVQPRRQITEHGIGVVGCDAFDDKLIARHAERQGGASFQEPAQPVAHTGCGWRERRMTGRIHGMLVDGERQLDQEIGQFTREGGSIRLLRRPDRVG